MHDAGCRNGVLRELIGENVLDIMATDVLFEALGSLINVQGFPRLQYLPIANFCTLFEDPQGQTEELSVSVIVPQLLLILFILNV